MDVEMYRGLGPALYKGLIWLIVLAVLGGVIIGGGLVALGFLLFA